MTKNSLKPSESMQPSESIVQKQVPKSIAKILERNQKSFGDHPSLHYLDTFVNNRSAWKFNKSKQTWILNHLWYPHALDKISFKQALKYMKAMAPSAKEVILTCLIPRQP